MESEALKSHLDEHKGAIKQYEKDKQALYQGSHFLLFTSFSSLLCESIYLTYAGLSIDLVLGDLSPFMLKFELQMCKTCAPNWLKKTR